MELVDYTDSADDLALTDALERDPRVMSELGGPASSEEVVRAHRRRSVRGEGDWWFKIVPEPSGPPAGTIGIWPSTHQDREIHEVGWMVLPAFQGRGIASAALALLLDRARADGRFGAIHAFPGVTNAPSNALCRKLGFERRGEKDLEFRGRPLRCAHWRLALAAGGPGRSENAS